MVFGHNVNKCILCPQRYSCGTYVNQSITNYSQNNIMYKSEEQPVIQSTSKTTKKSDTNSQEITALFLSIEDNLNKTNQELNSQNIQLREEIERIKEELENIKQQEQDRSYLKSDLEVEVLNDDQLLQEEKGLEIYNKNNQTVLREKKTIFGTKKWVEEKR